MFITILEDDETLAFALQKYFEDRNMKTRVFHNLEDAMNQEILGGFYLVDITLPDGLGYDYGYKVVKNKDAYLIYLTAKDDQKSILKGFESGSDDYITKPFTFEELDQRMNAIQKRIKPALLKLGDLEINTDLALVTSKSNEIYLSVQEYRILLLLMNNMNDVVSRDVLNDALNILDYTQDNTLNVAIARLRKKLEGIVKIEAVVKKGYKITV